MVGERPTTDNELINFEQTLMGFLNTIDNDSVAQLPAARFPGRIVIVDSEEQVEAACSDLQRS